MHRLPDSSDMMAKGSHALDEARFVRFSTDYGVRFRSYIATVPMVAVAHQERRDVLLAPYR